jgi:hypothetical protein
MPLLDHFHPPLFPRWSYESFHSMWAGQLAGQLNRRPLPPRFLAEANVHIGITVATDVATFDLDEPVGGNGPNGGVATAVWAPPQPPLVVPVDFAGLEAFEVRVYDQDRARKLVAAVELVSPRNKDRAESRRAFLDKCAAYLREGVSLAVVDVVTSRRHNFHGALMELFNSGEAATAAAGSDLYAVAYRVRIVGTRTQLEMWPATLALGQSLPTLPLWLAVDYAAPLELEAAYRETCGDAGIR